MTDKSMDIESKFIHAIATDILFNSVHGIAVLLNAKKFWENQPYGTRFYYGDGATEYVHIGVLRAEVAQAKEYELRVSEMKESERRSAEAIKMLRGNVGLQPIVGWCRRDMQGVQFHPEFDDPDGARASGWFPVIQAQDFQIAPPIDDTTDVYQNANFIRDAGLGRR